MLYSLIKPFLFMMDPERAHDLALKYCQSLNALPFDEPPEVNPVEVMGIRFPNRVGLAAGFDKDGVAIKGLSRLNFGFIEIGTVTPSPQPGNPKPRLFRLKKEEAIINRMGFPSNGVDKMVERLLLLPMKVRHCEGQSPEAISLQSPILGINIGKNKDTPQADAIHDYIHCMQKIYQFADYITINISSPNTPGLRDLQTSEYLYDFFVSLKNHQSFLSHQFERYVPLVVKVSPDLDPEQIKWFAEVMLGTEMDGLIATNTTTTRPGLEGAEWASEAGGLSGRPLNPLSTSIIAEFNKTLKNQIPIIGVGGISSPQDVKAKIDAGAQLVQVYSGLVYHGPELVNKLINF